MMVVSEDDPYRLVAGQDGGPPLGIDSNGTPSRDRLLGWLRDRNGWVRSSLVEHGAILLRGFDVPDARAFEEVARAVEPNLRNDFFGTPDNRRTDFAFPASEVSGIYPIGQHCEMSYLAEPPRLLFFGCVVPPRSGGETPLADFRRVIEDLDPEVVRRFEQGGIRIVRNFRGAEERRRLWTLPRWERFFGTDDRKEAEALCQAEGMEVRWMPGGGAQLIIRQPIFREHPVSGSRVWFNQYIADHLTTSARDYRRIYRMRPTLRHFLSWQLVLGVSVLKRLSPSSTLAFLCTYADGTGIPEADMEALRRAVWKRMAIVPWQRGDVLVIDNRSMSHGRMPFTGDREIVACLA